jgi:F-type H+-transporting ATPase subunit delta
MAELATLARPYAEALFKSAQSHGSDASGWLDQLAVIGGNVQLLQFADNPKVTSSQVFDLVGGLVNGEIPESARNFLRTVIDNGRLGVLPEIAHQYRALRNAVGGSADAVVYSAFSIDAPALADLGVALEKRFGRRLNLMVQLEPELIGGIRVVVGDEVLDTSVKARLQQMRAALTA